MIHPEHTGWENTITRAQYDAIEARLEYPLTEFLFSPRSNRFAGSPMSGKQSAVMDRNRLLGQPMGL